MTTTIETYRDALKAANILKTLSLELQALEGYSPAVKMLDSAERHQKQIAEAALRSDWKEPNA